MAQAEAGQTHGRRLRRVLRGIMKVNRSLEKRGTRRYRPLNSGFRLSRNAVIPSFMSWVDARRPNMDDS
jgi:hypothetical protein